MAISRSVTVLTPVRSALTVPLAKGLGATVKLADYRASAFARDTRKLWLQVEYKGRR